MKLVERTERRKVRRRYNLKKQNARELPRLTIFRSNRHISVQIIDDKIGETLVSASSLEKDSNIKGYNKEGAISIGKKIAEKALAKKINEVIFDIGSYKYHGRIASLIEASIEFGLNKVKA
jgi:large subunit ribosomal protein L18